MLQTKSRIFWPGIRRDLDRECQECALNKNSKPQKKNEIDFSDLFENFYPGNRVQIDFCEKGNEDFLVMVDQLSCYQGSCRFIAARIYQPRKLYEELENGQAASVIQ